MSTICKLCVLSSEADVASVIDRLFSDRNVEIHRETTEWAAANERETFLSDYVDPTILSVKQGPSGVTEIYFNSFSKVTDLALKLSADLASMLVVNQYQSAATASYWAYYLKGEQLRTIEAGDGEIYEQTGIPLEFESNPPGHDIAEDGEEPCIIFDYEDMDSYNASVGIPVEIYQQQEPHWDSFFLPSEQKAK